MKDELAWRVRSAAVAGWWTFLVVLVLLCLQWAYYLWIVSARPAWLLAWCGPNVTWEQLQTYALYGIMILKIAWWLMLWALIWVSLWARLLRRAARKG